MCVNSCAVSFHSPSRHWCSSLLHHLFHPSGHPPVVHFFLVWMLCGIPPAFPPWVSSLKLFFLDQRYSWKVISSLTQVKAVLHPQTPANGCTSPKLLNITLSRSHLFVCPHYLVQLPPSFLWDRKDHTRRKASQRLPHWDKSEVC